VWYEHTDGTEQKEDPGSKPEGIIALANILKEHATLKSLCGNSGNETELDMSGNKIGVAGAIMLAPEIIDNGAMTSLNLANNSIVAESKDIKVENSFKQGDVVDCEGVQCPVTYACSHYYRVTKLHGIIAIANAIPDMRAMTSLNLASNNLMAEGAKIVAEAIKVTKCTPAIILVPFSCPSDFSINSCYLLLSAGYGGDDEPQSCWELYLLEQRHGWDQAHYQCYKGACGHFGTIFISI
jgi:hypothetical protein